MDQVSKNLNKLFMKLSLSFPESTIEKDYHNEKSASFPRYLYFNILYSLAISIPSLVFYSQARNTIHLSIFISFIALNLLICFTKNHLMNWKEVSFYFLTIFLFINTISMMTSGESEKFSSRSIYLGFEMGCILSLVSKFFFNGKFIFLSQVSFRLIFGYLIGDFFSPESISSLAIQIILIIFLYRENITERKIFRSRWKISEELFMMRQSLVSQLPENLIIIGKKKSILYINEVFSTNFGYIKDPISLSSFDIIPDSPKPVSNDRFNSKPSEMNLYHLLTEIMEMDKNYKPIVVNALLRDPKNPENSLYFIIKLFKQVWDGGEAVVIILKENSEHKDAKKNRSMEAMIASILHDLRTPLNGMMGSLTIIDREKLSQKTQECLELFDNSCKILLSLVNTLLDRQQLKDGRFKIVPEKFNFPQVLAQVKDLFDFQCRMKNIFIDLEIAPHVPASLISDKDRITQVLMNLIGNAIKFTYKGGIKIKAQPCEEPDLIEVIIEDSGVGIKPEDLDKLFKLYGKLDNQEFNTKGIGFGLVISNEIVKQLNNGTPIRVDSIFGKGTTFSFFLKKQMLSIPLNRSASKRITESSHFSTLIERTAKTIFTDQVQHQRELHYRFLNKTGDSSPPRNGGRSLTQIVTSSSESLSDLIPFKRKVLPSLLVVDDNPYNIMAVKESLNGLNLDVQTAMGGEEALQRIRSLAEQGAQYDVVLLDIEMPDLDGYEVMSRIKEMIEGNVIQDMIVIGLSARAGEEERVKAKSVGMVDFLEKPVSAGQIKKVLTKMMIVEK